MVHQAFNPIKVLFLHSKTETTKQGSQDFQSYQGSIFTTEKNPGGPLTASLSILSRFYFYCADRIIIGIVLCFQSYQGSIFTVKTDNSLKLKYTFQSYQGSIFTLIRFRLVTNTADFQSYQGSIFTR